MFLLGKDVGGFNSYKYFAVHLDDRWEWAGSWTITPTNPSTPSGWGVLCICGVGGRWGPTGHKHEHSTFSILFYTVK